MAAPDSTVDEFAQLRRRVADLESRLEETANVRKDLEFYRERWQRIVENSPDVIVTVDRRGVIDYISRPNRPEEEVVGSVSFDYLAVEQRDAMQAGVAHVFATGESLDAEIQDIEGHWFSVRLAPLRFEGAIDSVVAICTDITDRKIRENELREKEARLRLLLRQLPAIVFTTDRGLRFTSSLGAGLERLGLQPGQVVGQSVYEFFDTRDESYPPIAAMRNALRGKSDDYQLEFQGNVYRTLIEPLRDAQGAIEGTLGVALDITEHRQLELTLRESEARLRQMAESIHDVFYIYDPREKKVLYISPAYDAIWGRSRDEVYADPQTVIASLHPDDREQVGPKLQARLEGAGEPCIQYRILRPDGDVRWIEDRCYDMRDDGAPGADGPRRLAGICSDITHRKNDEEKLLSARDALERSVAERTRELRLANRKLREDIVERKRIAAQLTESEQRFRVLVEASPIPVVISEHGDGTMVYVNPRMAELLRLTEDQLEGRRVTEFYEDPADRRLLLAGLQRDGFVRDREVRFQRADGEAIWVSISMRDIEYNGQQRLYAGLVDITKTKQAEESLRAERRLLKRLLELHERDRQLIAYEIHDGIVQDMTGAAMFAEAAQHAVADREDVRGRLDQSLKLLRGSIDEARRMITGLRPPILEDQGLVAAIENFVEETSLTNELNVDLRQDVKFGRIAPALEMAIYRIVQEGLNNVWQHSGSKVARVELVQKGEEVRVTVQDWGCGFDQSGVKTRRYGLLGIKERARLLGGRAQVSSSPGNGTRIDVTLPLSDVLLPDETGETELKSSGL
ncbi:MAG: PAS domain S-box protein [Pirellulaceae bacterium]